MHDKELQVFKDYLGIKLHFNEENFIWKPSYGNRITEATLLKRKDLRFIKIVTQKFRKRREWVDYFISAFYNYPDIWIGEILEDEIETKHKKRIKKIRALEYNMSNETEHIINFMEKNNINIRGLLLTKNDTPAIIKNQSEIIGGVSDETLALLEVGFKFCKHESNDPLWQRRKFLIAKYSHLIDFNKENLKGVLQRLAEIKGESQLNCNNLTQQQKENTICLHPHLPI